VRESTVDWKLSVLVALNKNYAGTVVMIDDSVALAKGIRQANHNLEKAVVTILYNGPLTYTAVARGASRRAQMKISSLPSGRRSLRFARVLSAEMI